MPPLLAVPESPPLDVGCEVNPDCPVHKACFNRICRDPCVVNDPCGINAFCRVEAHQAVCRCPEGYLGNPRVECKLREYSLLDIAATFSKSSLENNFKVLMSDDPSCSGYHSCVDLHRSVLFVTEISERFTNDPIVQ